MDEQRLGDFTSSFAAIDYRDRFTAAEFAKLHRGIPDLGSDTKWQVRVDNLTCYLFRNWTDCGIYTFRLTPREGCYEVADAQVRVDDDRYATHPLDQEPALLRWVVRHVLLEEDLPYPL